MRYGLVTVFLILFSAQSHAQSVVQCTNDVSFTTEVGVRVGNGTRRLILNGVGRKRVVGINVFFAALYLERASNSAANILASNQIKMGIIHATINISRKRLVDMWTAEFDRLCGNECEQLRPFHNRFLSYAREVKKNERMYLILFPDRFEFVVNNQETYDPIYSPGYGRLMQRVLIGPEAEDKDLENGLLGKTQICRADRLIEDGDAGNLWLDDLLK